MHNTYLLTSSLLVLMTFSFLHFLFCSIILDSVMFAARDILRMEMLSASRDQHSHESAAAFLNTGQMATFDPRQTSEGLVLSCSNHCAHKVCANFQKD